MPSALPIFAVFAALALPFGCNVETRPREEGDAGTPHGVHPRSFADPRSPTGHATVLRAARYRALHDPADPDACAQCHDGAGPRPANVLFAAPGATECTSCHTEPGGVSACSTCHVAPFASEARNDAHSAHSALDCSTCHPRPAIGDFSGPHADGYVEVWFDQTTSGRAARFDGKSRGCTGTCHDRGGTTPSPIWRSDGPALDCNSCHASPPKAHFTGPCTSCHAEANATGTALTARRLHANGEVDLGDGSGRCGACHGSGDSPWPSTGAHAAHASPTGAAPVACETCHVVPGPNDAHPLRGGAVTARLAGLATKGGRRATYDPATQTCASTYCHEGAGGAVKAPRWTDPVPVRACGSCHATPPPAPHPQLASCAAASCHAGITTDELTISAAGRAVHVNGSIDRRLP